MKTEQIKTPDFKIGDKVRIIRGRHPGMLGVIIDIPPLRFNCIYEYVVELSIGGIPSDIGYHRHELELIKNGLQKLQEITDERRQDNKKN